MLISASLPAISESGIGIVEAATSNWDGIFGLFTAYLSLAILFVPLCGTAKLPIFMAHILISSYLIFDFCSTRKTGVRI